MWRRHEDISPRNGAWNGKQGKWLHVMVRSFETYPDSKVHGTNMGPTWGRQDPGGPHMGHVNFAIWVDPRLIEINICHPSRWPACKPSAMKLIWHQPNGATQPTSAGSLIPGLFNAMANRFFSMKLGDMRLMRTCYSYIYIYIYIYINTKGNNYGTTFSPI